MKITEGSLGHKKESVGKKSNKAYHDGAGCALTLVCSSMMSGIRPRTSENLELLVLFD